MFMNLKWSNFTELRRKLMMGDFAVVGASLFILALGLPSVSALFAQLAPHLAVSGVLFGVLALVIYAFPSGAKLEAG